MFLQVPNCSGHLFYLKKYSEYSHFSQQFNISDGNLLTSEKNCHISDHPKQPFRGSRKKISHVPIAQALAERAQSRASSRQPRGRNEEAPVRLTPAGVPVASDRAGLQQLYFFPAQFPLTTPSSLPPTTLLLTAILLVYLLDEIHSHTTLRTQTHKQPGNRP